MPRKNPFSGVHIRLKDFEGRKKGLLRKLLRVPEHPVKMDA